MAGTRSTLVKFTVFLVVSVLLFTGLYRMMTNSVSGDVATWTARFESVSGLREGDDVRVAGVRVGRVEGIEVAGNDQAKVTFSLAKGQRVYRNTTVTLRYQNLLGQRYLALSVKPERGPALPLGTQIPLGRTSPGFDLTALLNGFEPLFNTIEPGEVNRLATSLVRVLQGESGTVEQLLRNTAEATEFLASRDQVLTQVLRNLTPVLQNLARQGQQFDATVVEFRQLMTGLARQRSQFADTIDHLGSLVESTSGLLKQARPPLDRDVASLREAAALLARERPRLLATIEALPVLLSGFGRAMSYGAYMNVYMCTLGIEAPTGQTVWIGGNGPNSEACR